jgi:hypothetical protein
MLTASPAHQRAFPVDRRRNRHRPLGYLATAIVLTGLLHAPPDSMPAAPRFTATA